MDFSKTIALFPDAFEVCLFPELDYSITGADLRRKSGILAAWLQEKGYTEIAIQMRNCPAFAYLLTGALRAGVKVMLLNVLNAEKSELPVFDEETTERILQSRLTSQASFAPYEWRLNETMILMSTSGTSSGAQKTVGKSLQSFFGKNGVRPYWRLVAAIRIYRLYTCFPWYHNAGIFMLLLALCGVPFTHITAGKFNPDNMRRNINRTHPDIWFGTPTMLTRCVETGEITLPAFMVCTGEKLAPETITLLEQRGGAQWMINDYGSTEIGGAANMLYLFDDIRPFGRLVAAIISAVSVKKAVFNKKTYIPGCLGTPMKNVEIRIMRDGKTLGEGEIGEIFARTNTMYVRQGNVFYDTGDMGYMKDGLLFYVGRSGSVINRSGEKILPEDIERVLRSLPGVNAAVVFAVPSRTHGEDICAAVESENGAPVVTVEALQERLPKYMLPQRLLFFEKLPMTESGKTNLSALRDYAMK